MSTAADHFHIGRSWTGHELEDGCPCIKAPCGLVDIRATELADIQCDQHRVEAAKTIRQMHPASACVAEQFVLFIGTRRALDQWMYENHISAFEHGKRIKWGANGAQHLRGVRGRVKIVVTGDPDYVLTPQDRDALQTAKMMNDEEDRL